MKIEIRKSAEQQASTFNESFEDMGKIWFLGCLQHSEYKITLKLELVKIVKKATLWVVKT